MFKTLKDCLGDPPLSSITPLKAPIFDNAQNRDTPQSPRSSQNEIHETQFMHSLHSLQVLEVNREIKQRRLSDKRCWTQEEDALLRQLIYRYGAKGWSNLAANFSARSGKQCRERWHNHLRAGVRKGDWTLDEEWILALAVKAHGNKWSTISQYLVGRTDNTIKNHWNCKMKPKKAKFEMRIKQLLANPDRSFTEVQAMLIKKILDNPEREAIDVQSEEESKLKNAMKAALREFKEVKRQIDRELEEEELRGLLFNDN